MKLDEFVDVLVCPTERTSLKISEAGADRLAPILRSGAATKPVGATQRVLVAANGDYAYPVIDNIPILLAPEKLVAADQVEKHPAVDLKDPKYEEAYEEMEAYNAVGEKRLKTSTAEQINAVMGPLAGFDDIASIADSFPEPANIWIDAKHDSISQLEAYQYLAPIKDKIFLQLGGSGSHAVKALLAGAKKAFLVTPMLGEARYALQLAKNFGVEDRMASVLGVGEEIPFANESLDLIYSGGCFHHMRLDYAAAQMHMVLKKGGRFSGVDPWKTPLHTIGTRIIGKRETSVHCRPITPQRLAPMQAQFRNMIVNRHGPVLRYGFLAMEKAGLSLSTPAMMKITRLEDKIGRPFGVTDNFGGSLVIAGTK